MRTAEPCRLQRSRTSFDADRRNRLSRETVRTSTTRPVRWPAAVRPTPYRLDTRARTRRCAPAGYGVRWDGEWQLTLDVFRDLGRGMAVAIALSTLCSSRGSARCGAARGLERGSAGLIGVLPGFALLAPLGIYFSATAMIGVIALSGIVVRNSIVLVEFIEDRIAHGAHRARR